MASTDKTAAQTPTAQSPTDGTSSETAGDPKVTTTPAEPKDDLVTTRHSLTIGRETLSYTATTGRIVLREEVYEDDVFTGTKPKAEVFVTSYVADRDTDAPERPVTFAFNGGPGSSSVWLHIGLLGPRRVQMGDVGELLPPPYGLIDNPESLLSVSDLVFIDPVSTGFSRAAEGEKPKGYHGFSGDIESVGEVIRLWTSRNERWLSPKFLAGESYGTLRAAALADHLQSRYGLTLNGLMLISSVLDFGSIGLHDPDARAFAGFLPTYAAVAHYHGKHGRKSLSTVVRAAEEYAAKEYPYALSRGMRLVGAERDQHVTRVAELTGLSPDWVDRADLRIEHIRFFTELLRSERKVVGRLDSRFTGPSAAGNAEMMDADPSHDAISGPYSAAWNQHVRADLGYHSDLHYEQISSRVHPWSYADFEGRSVDVTPLLARAMRANPHLQVHVAYGWFDGATPFFAAREVLTQLDIPAALHDNIEHRYYEAGHMMYVHEPSRVQQSQDLADFVTRSMGTSR
ncbi:S10 family peptidase [Ornithinimicrobium faecis]|uniref:Peptidase S10 n=1 Tax=Ornithinimicrobium faecis TaxID=2934158 RepID=A0ABY4YR80_9MICO|nr:MULTISPECIES: peptidase S10 [unclassified Ornithinimicrobium]USQ78785.1 peptidase S10 [Ornithinimicrobium sp. HY1793]